MNFLHQLLQAAHLEHQQAQQPTDPNYAQHVANNQPVDPRYLANMNNGNQLHVQQAQPQAIANNGYENTLQLGGFNPQTSRMGGFMQPSGYEDMGAGSYTQFPLGVARFQDANRGPGQQPFDLQNQNLYSRIKF